MLTILKDYFIEEHDAFYYKIFDNLLDSSNTDIFIIPSSSNKNYDEALGTKNPFILTLFIRTGD